MSQSTRRSARPAYTSETGQPTKVQFATARNAALTKQRDSLIARFAVTHSEASRLVIAQITGTASDPAKVRDLLAKHQTAKLVADIARLDSKITH